MIPDRDDFWLASAPSKHPPTPPSSGPLHHPHHSTDRDDDLHSRHVTKPDRQRDTAWMRYCSYIEAMTNRGQKVNQRLALEAMFLGGNLVYRAPPPAPQDCAAS